MTSRWFHLPYIRRPKDGLNRKLSTGWADIKRHGVLIAAAIFSKVLTRISCATPCAERLA
jgi:hypothetical protein